MRSKLQCLAALALAGLLCVPPAIGWGNEGHLWINRAAALNMPLDYPKFMRTPTAVEELEYLGPEPDRWRSITEPSLKNAQEPEHFIDLETVAGFETAMGPLPVRRFDYYHQLAEFARAQAEKGNPQAKFLTPEKIGLQPWATAETWQRLIVAFREYRQLKADHKPTAGAEQAAILYAGVLGHYVGDAANPLHTTVRYNGWTGRNPEGYTTSRKIHSQFEALYVKDNLKLAEVRSGLHRATALYDDNQAAAGGWQAEWDDYIDYLKHSNELVEPLYKLEKDGGFEGRGTPEGHKFVVDRLTAGAQMLSDMWYTAWKQSAVELAAR